MSVCWLLKSDAIALMRLDDGMRIKEWYRCSGMSIHHMYVLKKRFLNMGLIKVGECFNPKFELTNKGCKVKNLLERIEWCLK